MVLVGSDSGEARLLEHEGFEVLFGIFLTIFAWVHVDHMETGLISVHGVENNLEDKVVRWELGNGVRVWVGSQRTSQRTWAKRLTRKIRPGHGAYTEAVTEWGPTGKML